MHGDVGLSIRIIIIDTRGYQFYAENIFRYSQLHLPATGEQRCPSLSLRLDWSNRLYDFYEKPHYYNKMLAHIYKKKTPPDHKTRRTR